MLPAMRRTLVVTKLGDECADYLLTVACRKCRHVRAVEPHALAKTLGWEITLIDLSKRLRCSSCGEKDLRADTEQSA
jgi:hypothetical protein